MSSKSVHDLNDLLNLDQDPDHKDRFIGRSHWMPTGRVFGGQIVGQGLQAMAHTIPDDRLPHSLHGYFLRAGDTQLPVEFDVERIHDGRSFSSRRAVARQSDQPIFSMMASFQTNDRGAEHSISMPTGIPAPETLPSSLDLLESLGALPENQWSQYNGVELRHVTSPVFVSVDADRRPIQQVWFRAHDHVTGDQMQHRVALAYASDYAIMEPVLRVHGSPWVNPDSRTASLDHAIWFHRDVDINDWLLYDISSPTSQQGRGLCEARIWSRDGRLVATVAQEVMFRLKQYR